MNTKFYPWFFILVGLLGSSVARAELKWSGYYRNLLFAPWDLQGVYTGDINSALLDLQATGLDEQLRFRLSLDLAQSIGESTAFELGDRLTGPSGIPLGLRPVEPRVRMLRAFLQYRPSEKPVELLFGHQRISWGVGRILRPTDVFEPMDLFDPFQEYNGVSALRVRWRPHERVFVDGVSRLDPYDNRLQTGVAVSLRPHDRLELTPSILHDGLHGNEQLGLAISGEGPLKYWLEAAYRFQTRNDGGHYDDTHQLLLETGVEYTIPVTWTFSVLAEYLLLSNGDPLNSADYFADAVEDFRVLQARNYLYLQGTIAPSTQVTTRMGILVNLDDGSWVLMPRVVSRPLDSLELSLGFQINTGPVFSEFRMSELYDGLMVPGLAYLLTTWYF